MKIIGLLLFPSLFLVPTTTVVVAFAPRILISKTYKTGRQHHYSCLIQPGHRVGVLSSSVNHCSRSGSSNNHNTLPAGNESVWDRLTLNTEASWLCFLSFFSLSIVLRVVKLMFACKGAKGASYHIMRESVVFALNQVE